MESRQCGATARNGTPCRKGAGWGTDHSGYGHCKHHGGSSPNGRLPAAKLEAAAKAEHVARVMGFPVDVDPMQALLNCIRIAAGEVEYTTFRVGELSGDDVVVSYAERSETDGVVRGEAESSVSTKTSSTTELHIWIRARHDALDRLARYSKMAIDAGIAERQVVVAEQVGGMIGVTLKGALAELALTPEQQAAAPEIVRRHLQLLAGPKSDRESQ